MKNNDKIVSITIFGKPYNIKCPIEQAHELQEAAHHLNEHMRKLHDHSKKNNLETLAIISALNIAHEWLQLKNQKNQYIENTAHQIRLLQEKIKESLVKPEEVLV